MKPISIAYIWKP